MGTPTIVSFSLTYDNQILLPVRLTHSGKQAIGQMLLDTGANYTVIDLDTANKLGLAKRSVDVAIQTAQGSLTDVSMVKLEGLFVAGHHSQDFGLQNSEFYCAQILKNNNLMGLIGLDFFKGMKYSIDSVNQELTIEVAVKRVAQVAN